MNMENLVKAIGGLGCIIMGFIGITTIPAWFTHVIYCFQHHEWGFLIGGALFFPVAIVHGWGIWFGWWG